jgi:hypothetical protein
VPGRFAPGSAFGPGSNGVDGPLLSLFSQQVSDHIHDDLLSRVRVVRNTTYAGMLGTVSAAWANFTPVFADFWSGR